jgi:AbrB family looped-hinge helix DNA binding protein
MQVFLPRPSILLLVIIKSESKTNYETWTMLPFKITTISSKGQLTIPKAVCDRLGIKPGDKVVMDARRDREGLYLAVMKATKV